MVRQFLIMKLYAIQRVATLKPQLFS